MNRRHLEQAIQQAFDGDPEKAEALRRTLLEDPAALDLWCDYALMESELRRHAAGRLNAVATRRKPRLVGWLASAAAVLVLSASWLVFRGGEMKPATLAASPESIVRDAAGDLHEAGDVPLGAPLSLVRGVMRIELPDGTCSVIEGPATVTLVSHERMTLDGGIAWVSVPSAKATFTVASAALEVTGSKGEFGVDLREDRPMEVHSFQGKVETRPTAEPREGIELEAGDAASLLQDGTWRRMTAERRDFLDRLPPALPMIHLTFDRLENHSLEIGGSGLGSASAVAVLHHPQGARLVPGVNGMALEMDGTGSWVATSWTGISGTAPRTVSLWCRIPKGSVVETAPPLALWGNPLTGWNRKFKFALVRQPDGRTTLRGSFGERLANGLRDLADGEWHHLAMVYRGRDAINFFVDGEAEPVAFTGPADDILTDTRSDTSITLSLGRYELAPKDRNPFLKATLDDLKIHAGALAPDEIRELAKRR